MSIVKRLKMSNSTTTTTKEKEENENETRTLYSNFNSGYRHSTHYMLLEGKHGLLITYSINIFFFFVVKNEEKYANGIMQLCLWICRRLLYSLLLYFCLNLYNEQKYEE